MKRSLICLACLAVVWALSGGCQSAGDGAAGKGEEERQKEVTVSPESPQEKKPSAEAAVHVVAISQEPGGVSKVSLDGQTIVIERPQQHGEWDRLSGAFQELAEKSDANGVIIRLRSDAKVAYGLAGNVIAAGTSGRLMPDPGSSLKYEQICLKTVTPDEEREMQAKMQALPLPPTTRGDSSFTLEKTDSEGRQPQQQVVKMDFMISPTGNMEEPASIMLNDASVKSQSELAAELKRVAEKHPEAVVSISGAYSVRFREIQQAYLAASAAGFKWIFFYLPK